MGRRIGLAFVLILATTLAAHAQSSSSVEPATPATGTGLLLDKGLAALIVSALIIAGGLAVSYFRAQGDWAQISVQTLGTIFFFPTLILLGVFLDLEKGAITTILGAFVGYLFGRGTTPKTPPTPGGGVDQSPSPVAGTGGVSASEGTQSKTPPPVEDVVAAPAAATNQPQSWPATDVEESRGTIVARKPPNPGPGRLSV